MIFPTLRLVMPSATLRACFSQQHEIKRGSMACVDLLVSRLKRDRLHQTRTMEETCYRCCIFVRVCVSVRVCVRVCALIVV